MNIELYDEKRKILKITLKNGVSELVSFDDLFADLIDVVGEDLILSTLEDIGAIEIEE